MQIKMNILVLVFTAMCEKYDLNSINVVFVIVRCEVFGSGVIWQGQETGLLCQI